MWLSHSIPFLEYLIGAGVVGFAVESREGWVEGLGDGAESIVHRPGYGERAVLIPDIARLDDDHIPVYVFQNMLIAGDVFQGVETDDHPMVHL
jgi:hypothetical protein